MNYEIITKLKFKSVIFNSFFLSLNFTISHIFLKTFLYFFSYIYKDFSKKLSAKYYQENK